MSVPEPGDVHVVERTFTADAVTDFAALSRDTQSIHTEEDPPMVHGLLTATLPTQIGGDLNVLARTMSFEFVEPVYAGDTVRCEWTTTSVDERADRYDLTADVVCDRITAPNASTDGTRVLEGHLEGLVWRRS